MAIVVKSAFWNDNYAGPITGYNTLAEQVSKMFARPGMQREKAIVLALLGVAPGATATVTKTRIQASTTEQGGKRVVENYNEISRATTAADVTGLTANTFNHNPRINTPVDGANRA